MAHPTGIDRLLEIMARLRDPGSGCPWDLEQSFRTIAPHTIEEAYEVADAIERDDMPALKDELGDLLFQVVFYAQMAGEAGTFDFDAIAGGIADKMIRRHPHVFGSDAPVATAAAQTHRWEDQKASERASAAGGTARVLDGVTTALPAMTRAVKLQKRAARVGFDWPETSQVLDKIDEELGELRAEVAAGAAPDRLEDEVGDLLFALVNLARHLSIEPEGALRRTNRKFERRFRQIEDWLVAADRSVADVDLEMLEALWQCAKAEENDAEVPPNTLLKSEYRAFFDEPATADPDVRPRPPNNDKM